MIIELIGPGGVGKTTLEPMVAKRLGLEYHPNRKRHALNGEPLTPGRVWLQRLGVMARNPRLFVRAATAMKGGARLRLRFALDMCRRERLAHHAATRGGVVASGTLHALCAASANHQVDLSPLLSIVSPADFYVLLVIEPEEATRRLAGRLFESGLDAKVEDHAGFQRRYDSCVAEVEKRLTSPILRVEAGGPPERVVDEVVSSINATQGMA